MENKKYLIWQPYVAEFIGTAILVCAGLSPVIFMFGTGNPMAEWIPDEGIRILITGFLFGSTGALISISPVGKENGTPITPVVTLTCWWMRKIHPTVAAGYIPAQLTGAVFGALPLLIWRSMGQSVAFGTTLPGIGYSMYTVILGEVITTFSLATLLMSFIEFRKLRFYTPAIFPILNSVMVYAEAPTSGTSTNPARSLGPSVISGEWSGWWIY